MSGRGRSPTCFSPRPSWPVPGPRHRARKPLSEAQGRLRGKGADLANRQGKPAVSDAFSNIKIEVITANDDATVLTLTALELIEHLAALSPPPKRHRHRCHGVRAPNSPLRAAATIYGRDAAADPSSPTEVAAPLAAPNTNVRSPARALWGMLAAWLFESLPLTCPSSGADSGISIKADPVFSCVRAKRDRRKSG